MKGGRLLIGGPSVTDSIERSKAFQTSLVSFHENLEALSEYQASPEHHKYVHVICVRKDKPDSNICSVTSTYIFPYKEDLMRLDFEVDDEDEYMCDFPLLR